jgi:pilus assembly protein CpaB
VNTVTLAVTPDESEKLALASNDGKIQLVMRNFADAGKVETPGSDKGGLLSSMRSKPPVSNKKQAVASRAVYRKASAPAPVQVVKAGYVVEVIKGGKRSEETFQ